MTDYKDGLFIYTQDNLAGAVYEIHAAADIATPDRQGTYWYKDGDLVATVTTGAEGQVDEVKFSPTRTQATYDFLKITHDSTKGEVTVTLPLGKYTITEVQAPYGFVLTQQSYTVEFGWDNQKNDIVLAKTIVSHEQDGDKKCSYSIVNVKDASDAHKNGQTLVFENARVLPTPEKPGDKVSKIGVGIYKQDREALTYLPGAVYELYTVDDIYSADGTKLLEAGTKLATSSTTNASGFTWFDVDIPIRAKTYPDSGNSGRYRIVEVKAPAGYLLDSTPVDVEFTYEGQQIAWQIVDGTNTNLRTTVDISKQDITNGKELPGAKLEIRDADGNLVEGWTSGKVPHTVRGLELEKEYTLTEKRAPDGYAEAESIVFKLVQELLAPSRVKGKNQFQLLLEKLPPNHKARWFAGSALDTAEQAMASVISTVLSRLNAFLDSEMEQILCFDTAIDAEKFCNEKSAIFIVLPEEDQTKYFMVSLILQNLYREILTVADENGGRLKNRVVFFADELGTCPPIQSLELMFSASRSRGLMLVPIVQSITGQLQKNYGKEGSEIIVDNCQVNLYGGFAPASQTAVELSKSLGSRTVMSGSISRGKNDPSQSLQMMERPLMTPDELKSMPKGSFIVAKTGVHPMKVKLRLFLDWGIRFGMPYEVPEKAQRFVAYADKQELEESIIRRHYGTIVMLSLIHI